MGATVDYLTRRATLTGATVVPAGVEDLRAAAAAAGVELSDLLAQYFAHVETGPQLELVTAFWTLSLPSALQTRSILMDAAEDAWNPSWLPFANFDADLLVVDTSTGMVLGVDEIVMTITELAGDLDAFCAAWLAALDAGLITADDQGGLSVSDEQRAVLPHPWP